MHHERLKHQKIKFRRTEIVDLSTLPSAEGYQSHWRQERRRRRTAGIALVCALAVGFLVAIVFGAAVFMVKSEWGTETLRLQAERAIQRIAGDAARVSIGPARIVFTADHPIALELQDIRIENVQSKDPIFTAGTVDFGIRMLPLLTGALQLGSASISGAQINIAAMPVVEGRDWTKILRDGRGLIDPDLLLPVVFRALHAAFDAVEGGFADEIRLKSINVALPEGERVRGLTLVDGSLYQAIDGRLAISATIDAGGRAVTVDGAVQRAASTRLIDDVALTISAEEPAPIVGESTAPSAAVLGGFSIRVTGAEAPQTRIQSLAVSAVLDKSSIDLGARGIFTGNMTIDAQLETDSNKIEISRLLLQTGRNSLEFNGAFGPRPPTAAAGDAPVYRYEFVGTKIVLAPEQSPEAPIDVQAKVEGTFDPVKGEIATSRFGILAGNGEANGNITVDLVSGKAPGVAMAFLVQNFQVAEAKQLWPWFVAGKARAWALDHLFGGVLTTGHVDFKVEPGRLGDGVPLSAEEISGRYELTGTRFDIAGQLPPVRDATGAVEVHGRDVVATLASGTVNLPSGRILAGKNGTLTVASSNKPPIIGKLDVDVEGDAAALAEFASFAPLNAMRLVPFGADDLSGKATGHVIADIPLQKGIDVKTLEWIVALDYSNLSIAKPFAGQTVSDANGKMTIEPAQASITADAKLNGIPATISMVEPLKPDGPARQRNFELVLNDASRKKLAPGLDQIMSGTVKLAVDEKNGIRDFAADLTNARLDLPWVGWSKGKGIAAKASFSMDAAAGSTKISDFELDGDSFAAAGDITLANGTIASALFNKVRLNRGDDIRVKVDRSGKGYRIDVSGTSLDARAIVKRTVSDKPSGGDSGKSGTQNVSLKLSIDKVLGFNDEALSDVKLSSDATGVNVVASTKSGGSVNIENISSGGSKSLRVQAADAGAILRFLDIYKNMQGGTIKLGLAGTDGGSMKGQVDARNFFLVDEPRLASLVSTPAGGERSLSQAVRKDIDTSRVQFERGYAQIARGEGYLKLANGVVRGPQIGTTFQGTLYDQQGQMDMTGTFMPAYGLNRLFGELPLVGVLLGNGRDGGLIGVTFKLDGAAKAPRLQVNPLSIIAPGIFRQIFEFD